VVYEGDRRLANKKKIKTERQVGVLTKKDIEDRLEKQIFEPSSLIITPYPKGIDSDSIDLGLGNHFFVPRGHRTPCFVPGLTNPLHLYSEQYIPMGYYLVLPAHHTVLGSTLEYIKLPSDVSGEILTKSSWARTFITIETAPWIHPLYRGCLTLEIANVSNTPVVLYPGVKIAQLVLLNTMRDIAKKNKDEIEGTYFGPVRPEPAILKKPREALSDLGISREDVTYPLDEYFDHEEYQEYVANSLREQGYKVESP